MVRPFTTLPVGQILQGDVRKRLEQLPPSSVDCVITSPPYYALRDYGQAEQLGLEANVDEWVASLVGVCRQLARVLKPSGTLWLNVADQFSSHSRQGAAKKSLLLGPERLALALQRDGWIIRNKIVWAKANPMPSSIRDRLSCAHEVVLMLVRSRTYFFDLDVIREPHRSRRLKKIPKAQSYQYLPDQAVPEGGLVDLNLGLNRLKAAGKAGHDLGKNPGDVWYLPTAAYHGAHFATFPLRFVERPLLATCPEKVCMACGVPWPRGPVSRRGPTPTLGELGPGCDCRAPTQAGVVLDPFIGAATTALAAEKHGRQWIGIELNPEYIALAEQRLADWRAQQLNSNKEKQKS